MVRRKIEIYEHIAINPCQTKGKINFEEFFGRKAPVEIEIGSGKGTFLVNQAPAYENIDFLGIEWANKFYKHAVDRLGRHDIKNVRMIRTDAAVFIPEHVPDDSVSGYHIYFPDPWPKNRHHKRRFICAGNLKILWNTLVPGGWINIATDHKDYFDWINEHIDMCGEMFLPIEYKYPAGTNKGEMAGTNFERKYLKEGRIVYTTTIEKN